MWCCYWSLCYNTCVPYCIVHTLLFSTRSSPPHTRWRPSQESAPTYGKETHTVELQRPWVTWATSLPNLRWFPVEKNGSRAVPLASDEGLQPPLRHTAQTQTEKNVRFRVTTRKATPSPCLIRNADGRSLEERHGIVIPKI